jgi:hypothetical protein
MEYAITVGNAWGQSPNLRINYYPEKRRLLPFFNINRQDGGTKASCGYPKSFDKYRKLL